ncbi:MAG: recombinase family protein [Phycisphaerae bacterium]|jgi:putative DNA-invertase from lambdoid prophage Rac|nr:recombinase family protein [Phycisphaerae bacterium]
MDEFGGVFGQGGRECGVAIYARVSTHDQQTLPLQLAAMREYARRRGWLIVLDAEEVASGASKRVERQRVLDAARRREIDAILVWRLDRWGRSLADLVSTLDELRSLDVGFVSITEALDLTTPAGRAMAAMLSVFAEFEREVLRDRVRAGLASARERGTRLGRPRSSGPPPEALLTWLNAGESVSSIARHLSVPRSQVRRWIRRTPIAPL